MKNDLEIADLIVSLRNRIERSKTEFQAERDTMAMRLDLALGSAFRAWESFPTMLGEVEALRKEASGSLRREQFWANASVRWENMRTELRTALGLTDPKASTVGAVRELVAERDELSCTLDLLKADLSHCALDFEALDKEIAGLKAERDELRSECEEHRAWRCVDTTLVEQREEIARLRTERDGLLNQVAGHDEDIRRLHNERDRLGRIYQTEATELKTQLDRLTTELAQLKTPAEPAKVERSHPVKVGEWVRRTEECRRNPATVGVSEMGKVAQIEVEVQIEVILANGEVAWWYPKNCEPCDPPEASHDTPEGKESAESVIRDSRNTDATTEESSAVEPIGVPIGVGDVVEVVSNCGLFTWPEDAGARGVVEELISNGNVKLKPIEGVRASKGNCASLCDLRKVTP